jgi:hypothetical protein
MSATQKKSTLNQKKLLIKWDNDQWAKMIHFIMNMPGVSKEDKNVLAIGHTIISQGINKKIAYTQELDDTFYKLINTIMCMSEDVVEYMKTKSGIIKAVVNMHDALFTVVKINEMKTASIYIGVLCEINNTQILIVNQKPE